MSHKVLFCLPWLLGASLLLADEVTKRTEITVNEPVIVAGVPQVTLQPGKYVIKVLRHEHTKNIVQIFNAEENHLYTTVLAINNYRLFPKDKTTLGFYETPKGNPIALRSWFPTGENWGQEFVYPKGLAAQIAKESGQQVLASAARTEPEFEQAPVTEITPKGEEKPLEEAYKEPEPVVIAQAPAPVEVAQAPPAPVEEPPVHTASPIFTIGLAGLAAMAAGLGLRRFRSGS